MCAFFRRKFAVLSLVTVFFTCIFFFFIDPILTVTLTEDHGLSIGASGYAFALIAFCFGTSAAVWGSKTKVWSKRFICVCCLFSLSISLFCLGPSKLLHFPDKVWLMFLGMAGGGVSFSGIYAPAIPEIIDVMLGDLDDFMTEGDTEETKDKIKG
jgi:MFS family permease